MHVRLFSGNRLRHWMVQAPRRHHAEGPVMKAQHVWLGIVGSVVLVCGFAPAAETGPATKPATQSPPAAAAVDDESVAFDRVRKLTHVSSWTPEAYLQLQTACRDFCR